ncbi:MAG: tRNA 2-thiouridine(34) synthase MnmA, partial [Myxococcota bacterium]
MKVVVAMSGGVDSSAVAGLMVEQGHEVIGLAMKTHDLEPRQNRACCTPDDMRDARRVADTLGIPFYVLNYADVFREQIIGPFAQAYLAGRTPNPCVECNDKVKFRPMLKRAKLLGADRLVTGHYARIDRSHGTPRLLRGVDSAKDQSYFLYRLNAEQLAALDFPLGGMVKEEVRDHARRFGLPVAEKHESQEICFVGSEGYAATVEKIAGRLGKLGPILNQSGEKLGEHDGIHKYTYGQRRGLRISGPEPLYVTDIDAESGVVRVGPKQALLGDAVELEGAHW